MKKWTVLLATFFVFGLGGVGQTLAQQSDEKDSATMEEVIVTATRTETPLEQIGGSSVTIITAEDIEAKKQNTVEEILKGVPGFDIAANGGPGTLTSVFIRGADSKNTLVLVDGIMFNDPSSTNRGADLGNLTADNIERIEVVRGPMSVLYGSNATAGVINIITKKGKGKPSFYAGVEGGSYDTWKTYGGTSGTLGLFNFSLSASRTDSEGFSIANDDNERIPRGDNTSEKDGWENTTLTGKFGLDVTPDFDVSAVVKYLDSEIDLDDWGTGFAADRIDGGVLNPEGRKEQHRESDQIFGRFAVHNTLFEKFFESTLSYQYSDQERRGYDADGLEDMDYDGTAHEVAWQGGLNFRDTNILSFGAGYWKEEMDSQSSNIRDVDADIKSYWVQDQWFIRDALILVAGLRYDDHDRFGSEATYRFAPSYTVNSTRTTFKGSWGTGFRAPSLFELFSTYGNKDLDAEESEGWDIGFEQTIAEGKVKFGVTYFEMAFDNRIAFDMTTFKYAQASGETKTEGIESFVQWSPWPYLDFTLAYTWADTEDPDGELLTRRPKNKISVNTRYRFLKKGLFNIDFHWVDERPAISSAADLDGNSVETLDAYMLINLSASYDITDHLQLYGRVDNLFDEEYEEAWSYATPGLSGYAGVKFTY